MDPAAINIEISRSLTQAGLPVALSDFLTFLILLVIEIALIYVLQKLLRSIFQAVLRSLFRKQFHIALNSGVAIAPLLQSKNQGRVLFRIPFWMHANKDGSRDRRRQKNRLVRRKSTLSISHFVIKSYEPYAIYWLYRELVFRGFVFDQPKIVTHGREASMTTRSAQPLPKPPSAAAAAIYNHYIDHPTDFEEYCAYLFRKQGYTAETTPRTNDGGFDIDMTDPYGNRCLVECKCYNPSGESVGRDLLQKLVGANAAQGAQRMIFITTSHFTNGAIEYARSLSTPIELISGNELECLVRAVAINSGTSENVDSSTSSKQVISWDSVSQCFPPDVAQNKEWR